MAPRGAEAVQVSGRGAVVLRGAAEPRVGASRGGGAGALPLAGSGLAMGLVAPLRRRWCGLEGRAWCLLGTRGGKEFPTCH